MALGSGRSNESAVFLSQLGQVSTQFVDGRQKSRLLFRKDANRPTQVTRFVATHTAQATKEDEDEER